MTTADTAAKTPEMQGRIRLPDPPERAPDDMTSFDHLAATGNVRYLSRHFGNPDTTIVSGEHYITPIPTTDITGVKYPDLLIAFGVNPAAYRDSNAYVVSEQGKPPDFVLEIASRATGRDDTTVKRAVYAALGIPEYWRFDETGEYHRTRLAGDRLVGGVYVPLDIEELTDGSLQGYSSVLDLNIRWEHGQLAWYDPATGLHIVTSEDEEDARIREQARADQEYEARIQEQSRADQEQQRADTAEARADAAEAAADQEREARLQAQTRADEEREARIHAEAALRAAEERIRQLERGEEGGEQERGS